MKTGITCKQAVDYISKKEEGRLSATMRFQLWKHLAICSLCRLFSAQNKTMINAMGHEHDSTESLSIQEKEKIVHSVLEADQ
jgi:hypothetical protein